MRAFVAVAALLVACGDPGDPVNPGVDPNTIALDRRYQLSECVAACSASLGHGVVRVDSARLVLRADHTAEWMRGTSGTYNSCYLEMKDCTAPFTSVNIITGTYSFGPNVLYLNFDHGPLNFTGSISTRVPATWSGPDGLSVHDAEPAVIIR